jgi:hypothetical protein
MRELRRKHEDSESVDAGLTQTSQRLAAQLDCKAERLEQLLEEAQSAIARLERVLASVDQANVNVDPAGESAPDVAPRPPRSSPPSSFSPSPIPTGVEGHEALARSVYELADEGEAPVDIARRLDEQVGKVELILALREPGEEDSPQRH